MSFTLEHIHRTTKRLGRLLPARPNRDSNLEYSLKEGIFLMAPKLLEMKRMGFSTAELAAALESEGIAIKGQTLNRYLCEYQSVREREAAPAPACASSTEAHEDHTKGTARNPENAHQGRRNAAEPGESVSASGPDSGKTKSAPRPDSVESESAKTHSPSPHKEQRQHV